MHAHDQVSFLFMTRELSIMTILSFFFTSYRTEEEEEEKDDVLDSLYNCQFRLVLNIQWPDHDCMLVMIMITLLTGHRQ
jgi:hypothetical protein